MGDVVVQVSAMSVDGVMTAEDSPAMPAIDVADPVRDEWLASRLRTAGRHVMGGTTYESMAAHWPTSTEVFAEPMNTIPKVVFSATMTEATWPESSIWSGDVTAGLARLKELDGDVVVHGGVRFMSAVVATGLVDEYRLCVHPYVDGGRGLFADAGTRTGLSLLESVAFPTGSVGLVYRA